MTMSLECAKYIHVTQEKLLDLYFAAPAVGKDHEKAAIVHDLARLRPHAKEANNVIIAASEAEFSAAAKALTNEIRPITEAIADFKKINAALTAIAGLIDKITKLLAKIPV